MKYYSEKEMLKDTFLKEGDYQSTKEVFERIAKLAPDAHVLAELDNHRNIVYHTSKGLLEDVESFGDGLIALGLQGKHIALLAENSYKYFVTDVTIVGGAGIISPIDKDAKEDLLETLLKKCDADAVICSAYLIPKIKAVAEKCNRIKTIITIDKKVDDFATFDEIQKLGKKEGNSGKYRAMKPDLDAVAEIIFTSGTTGANKAVMLTGRNLATNMSNCLDVIRGSKKNNTSMSILPMHHATEIYTHIMPRVAAGRLTYINGSMKDMMLNMKVFKPYIITVVPMIANAFYKTIWQEAKKQGKDKKLKKGIKLCKILNKLGIDVTHKLFKDLFAPFGGNLQQIVCGGAPLDPEVVSGMRDLGVYIINGFGITECGPLVSMNSDTLGDCASIGKACPRLEVKIFEPDEEGVGELCVKGPSVSKGYYKDKEATMQVFDEEGFFHTGDLAKQNEKGELFLAGRKKNLIVLDSGKNVYPEELEQAIVTNIRYVKDTMVFEEDCEIKGEKKRLICAEIFLGDEKKTNNEIIADFRKLNQTIASYKRISYVEVLESDFERNASKKIMRKQALARHKKIGGLVI